MCWCICIHLLWPAQFVLCLFRQGLSQRFRFKHQMLMIMNSLKMCIVKYNTLTKSSSYVEHCSISRGTGEQSRHGLREMCVIHVIALLDLPSGGPLLSLLSLLLSSSSLKRAVATVPTSVAPSLTTITRFIPRGDQKNILHTIVLVSRGSKKKSRGNIIPSVPPPQITATSVKNKNDYGLRTNSAAHNYLQ